MRNKCCTLTFGILWLLGVSFCNFVISQSSWQTQLLHPNEVMPREFESNEKLRKAFYGDKDAQVESLIKAHLDILNAHSWAWRIKFAAKRFEISTLPLEVTVLLEISKDKDLKPHSDTTFDFIFIVPYHEAIQASKIRVTTKGNNGHLDTAMLINSVDRDQKVETYMPTVYVIKCPKAHFVNSKIDLQIKYYLWRPFSPNAQAILFDQDQYVVMKTTTFMPSLYTIEMQKTYYLFSHQTQVHILSTHRYASIVELDEGVLGSGPYLDIAPLSMGEELIMRFLYLSSLEFAQECCKRVKMSNGPLRHLKVTEEYTLINEAAKIRGGYNAKQVRDLIYRKLGTTRHIAFLEATLPKEAKSTKVHDELGVVSTVYPVEKATENINVKCIQIVPRYPLSGGWRMRVKLNYVLPTDSSIMQYMNGSVEVSLNPSIMMYMHDYNVIVQVPLGCTNVTVLPPSGVTYDTVKTRRRICGVDTEETSLVINFKRFHPIYSPVADMDDSWTVQINYTISLGWMMKLICSIAIHIAAVVTLARRLGLRST